MATKAAERKLAGSMSIGGVKQDTSQSDFFDIRGTGLLPSEISRIAEKLYENFQLYPAFDVFKVVKNLRGRVIATDISKYIGSSYLKSSPDGSASFEIIIGTTFDISLNRYLIAREIGHYFLHVIWQNRGAKVRKSVLSAEVEADIFAMSFLIPKSEWERLHESLGDEDLASRFNVPLPIIGKRRALLEMLG